MKAFIKTNIFYFIILVVVVFVLYGKSINYEFVSLDEDSLIVSKVSYLSSLKNIPNFFLTSCYFTNTSHYYRPILTLSFSLETSLFGVNKKIYHLTNIILFILALYLMYVFLIRIDLNKQFIKFILLLFAVHPIFSTLPIWIPARNDTLITIFVLLSFIELIKYIEFKKNIDFIFFILTFTLSVFTKESAIFLFILYPLFLYCFDYKISKQEVIKFSCFLLFIIVVYLYLRSISVASIGIRDYFFNALMYLKNICFGVTSYIYFFVYPKDVPILLFDENIKFLNIFIVITVLFGILEIYIRNVRYRKIIIFSLVWFVLFLFPTFLQKEYAFLTHRLLLASISIAIILLIIIDLLIKKYLILKKYGYALFIITFMFFSFVSFKFENMFSTKEIYWKQAYMDAPKYHITCYGLAQIYLSQGYYERYKELIFKAYNLSKGDAHIFNIINIMLYEGKIDEVKQICFNILNDQEAKKFHIIGANKILGNICFNENDFQKAYEYFKVAYDLNRFDLEVKNKLIELENKIK